jgi:4'-phosphopantetheinyl transferase
MKPDQVQVWQMHRDCSEDVQPAFELLDEMERARAMRYRLQKSRDYFIFARAFLRKALGHHLGIPAAAVAFRYTNRGKPELEGCGDLRFNLSHSGDAVVLAVTRGREVGIDVEETGRKVDAFGLAKRFFSRAEAEWVLSHSTRLRQHAFFTCWTGKEAYIKARGAGLRFPLDAFQVLPATDGLILNLRVYSDSEETRRWSMQKLQLGAGLSAATAVEGSGWTLQICDWPQDHSLGAKNT